jgi:hypothetical protein
MDPKLQGAIDSQFANTTTMGNLAQGMAGQVQGALDKPIDPSSFAGFAATPQAGNLQAITNPYSMNLTPQNIYTGGVGNSGYYNQAAGNAIYNQATSRLDPQWKNQGSDLETQLANQGVTPGSAAYDRAMTQFQQGKTDAYNQASMSATAQAQQQAAGMQGMDIGALNQQLGAQGALFGQQQAAGQFGLGEQQQAFNQQQTAGSQNFGQQLAAGQFQNATNAQQLQQAMALQNLPLQQMQALMGQGQVQLPQFGNYSQAGQGTAANLTGAAQATYNAQQAQQANTMGGWGSLLGTAAKTAFSL